MLPYWLDLEKKHRGHALGGMPWVTTHHDLLQQQFFFHLCRVSCYPEQGNHTVTLVDRKDRAMPSCNGSLLTLFAHGVEETTLVGACDPCGTSSTVPSVMHERESPNNNHARPGNSGTSIASSSPHVVLALLTVSHQQTLAWTPRTAEVLGHKAAERLLQPKATLEQDIRDPHCIYNTLVTDSSPTVVSRASLPLRGSSAPVTQLPAMESLVPENKRKGRPVPKRGQVKARIFEGLLRAIIPKALAKREEHKLDGDRSSSTDATPSSSGYASSYEG
ncbi:hypothetical protein B296_00004102 [Ensete ventricosum]|uniref:Uncharacterized protein n=1 Tax=Ensete ventricosum TaxID=4639 RepID=A0A426ZG48_ENSVE|nr:hypothetical protein B296_00004102 [Ensete ventricosum]